MTNNVVADANSESSTLLQLVTFGLGDEEFGLDILGVKEIIRMTEITRVPKAPQFVEGVINLRGRVIPIIDLRKRFSLDSKERDKDTRIIVVELSSVTVGFIVDSVSEVLRIPADTVEPPPQVVSGVEADCIKGVGKLDGRLLILMDVERILSSKEAALLAA